VNVYKLLSNLLGRMKEEVAGELRKLHDQITHDLYGVSRFMNESK
jgi:hypothetical protein